MTAAYWVYTDATIRYDQHALQKADELTRIAVRHHKMELAKTNPEMLAKIEAEMSETKSSCSIM